MGPADTRSAPLRTLAALLAALLVLGPGGTALAAPAKAHASIIPLPYAPLPGASEAFAARVFAQVMTELKQRGELKLVDAPANLASGPSAQKEQADAFKARESATQLFNKAGELTGKGKARQAAQALQKAVAQLTAQPRALDESGGKLLGDLLLQLAIARAMAGEDSDAALTELARRDPERALTSGSFPPAFLRSFELDRQHVLGSPRASIRVFAPTGATAARVLLDGRPLGTAPLMLTDALPGEHAVRVESGDDAWAESIKLDAGAALSLLPRLGAGGDEIASSLEQGRIDRAAASRLAKLAKNAGAQAVLVGTVAHEGDGYTVRSALVFARGEKVVPLASLALDAEMLSASLEVLRLADDLVAKLSSSSAPAATLPLAMGGAATEAPNMPSVAAAPPAPDTALALPAAADLAAAAGTSKKADLPLPDAEPPAAPAPAVVPLPLPAPDAALAAAPAPAPERAAIVPPQETASESPPPAERTPIIPSAQPDRTPVLPGAAPALAAAPAPIAPTPAPAPAPTPPPAAPVTPPVAAAPVPTPAPAPAPPSISGSLDAAVANLGTPAAPAPAPDAVPGADERRVFVPGAKPLPLPTAPSAAPATSTPAPSPSSDSAQLATAAPKRAEEPAPSRDLFVPRRPSQRDDDDQPTAVIAEPASPPAPAAATQVEAREANEIATVHEEQPKKNHAALWIIAGVVIAGAAVAGGIVLYSNSQTASNSNVSLSWSH